MECLEFLGKIFTFIFKKVVVPVLWVGCAITAIIFLILFNADPIDHESAIFWATVFACLFTGIGAIMNFDNQKELRAELKETTKALHDLRKAIIENGKTNMTKK